MGQVISLAAKLEEKAKAARSLQGVREVASAALWVDPSRITVVGKFAHLDGRPLTFQEVEAIGRYLDYVCQNSKGKASK